MHIFNRVNQLLVRATDQKNVREVKRGKGWEQAEGGRNKRSSSHHITSTSYHIISHHIISHHITSYHIISHHITYHHHITSYHIISHIIIISHLITSYHITSYHIISHHIRSYHITSYHIISHHITSHHITSYHIISHHITSYHIISHHITSYHITSYHIISHHITSHHITYHHHITSYHIISHIIIISHHIKRNTSHHIADHRNAARFFPRWRNSSHLLCSYVFQLKYVFVVKTNDQKKAIKKTLVLIYPGVPLYAEKTTRHLCVITRYLSTAKWSLFVSQKNI